MNVFRTLHHSVCHWSASQFCTGVSIYHSPSHPHWFGHLQKTSWLKLEYICLETECLMYPQSSIRWAHVHHRRTPLNRRDVLHWIVWLQRKRWLLWIHDCTCESIRDVVIVWNCQFLGLDSFCFVLLFSTGSVEFAFLLPFGFHYF